MKTLVITGDRTFKPGHPRFELQRSEVESLDAVYWGRGHVWPRVKGRYDVVTSQDPFWRGLFGWYIARRMRARLNIQVHADLSAQGAVRHVLAQIVLRHADSVRVVSEKLKTQVESIGVQAPVRVLPIFVDVSRFRTVVRKPHQQKTILWVGRFEQEKDPLCALAVLQDVRAAGVDTKLIMLGSGTLESAVKHAAKGLPVELPGWKDPVEYLPTADVVLSTSKHESYGVSMVEALAAGVPVVALDVGVAKEAGATVVARSDLARAVAEVLRSRGHGELKISLPEAQEWARQWIETL